MYTPTTNTLNQHFNWALVMLMLLSAALVTGCDTTHSEDDGVPSMMLEDPITVPFFIVDEAGEAPSATTASLYEARTQAPILTPDGEPLSMADFSTVQGTADVVCRDGGVFTEVSLQGLIPGGVYTLWNVTFHAPGMDPSKDLLNIRGLGAFGPADGSRNGFVATPEGRATISAFTPAGPLSMLGEIAACPLTDEVEYHLVGAYHLDGQTHGPNLGPDGTAVEQFGFIYAP